MATDERSKVVFVGNVPYNMTEEQLIEVFKSVGQVVGLRLVFDRETGKAKGYGFCEFADHETAQSAVRNLNNTDVGGRPLRIDIADSDPFLEGKTTVRGEILDGGYPGPSEPRSGWRGGRKDDVWAPPIPPGKPVPKGMTTLDAISQTLAGMPPSQLLEVLAQMKSFTIAHPEQAKQLFQKQPQLSYALFQALLLNNILPPETIYKMHAGTSAGSGPSNVAGAPPGSAALAPTPAPHARPPPHIPAQHPPPFAPQHPVPPFPPTGQQPQSMAPPPVAGYAAAPGYYRGTPVQPQAPVPPAAAAAPPATTAPAAQPANVAAAAAGIDDSQRDMLMYVLNMSQEAINALPEQQRASIMQLRNQFMPGVAPPS